MNGWLIHVVGGRRVAVGGWRLVFQRLACLPQQA